MVEIQRATGVSNPTMTNILTTDRRIYLSTEEAILSTRQKDVYDHCREVPSSVPARMLRSLSAIGWTPTDIARVSALHVSTIKSTRDDPRPRVYRVTADLIGQTYDYLLSLPRPKGDIADRQRAHARRKGWAAPTMSNHWKAAA
jgi:hypothetical protein